MVAVTAGRAGGPCRVARAVGRRGGRTCRRLVDGAWVARARLAARGPTTRDARGCRRARVSVPVARRREAPHRCPTGAHPAAHASCYARHGCRCRGCTQRHAESTREHRARIVERRRREGMRCPDCGGVPGSYDAGRCSACYAFQRRHGIRRKGPLRRSTGDSLACRNCGCEITTAQSHSNGRCERCSAYLRATGRERPPELERKRASKAMTERDIARRRLADRIARAWLSGESQASIARRMGMSRSSVGRLMPQWAREQRRDDGSPP